MKSGGRGRYLFREVGEGTGRGVDLDRFDLYYTHLFLWNKEKEEVVGGGYRRTFDTHLRHRGGS